MNTEWTLNTHGDPLGTLQKFIAALWRQTNLDAMVVPPGIENGSLLKTPEQLKSVNPFQPLMKANTARRVVEAAQKSSETRLGVLLRPCEMRALHEMAARGAVRTQDLLIICVDCLGTFPAEEYEWRAARSAKSLTKEALRFAPQGGISAYRYRPACQMCTQPGAVGGDVNIGVLGLPVRQSMLVQARNGKLVLESLTDGMAEGVLVAKREKMLAKISDRHGQTRKRVINGLNANLPADLDALMDQFEACGECQSCLDVCPICSVDYPRRVKGGRMQREDLVNWLVSCAGCGMCEQACPKSMPLSSIFSRVRDQIEVELAL